MLFFLTSVENKSVNIEADFIQWYLQSQVTLCNLTQLDFKS